MVGLLCSTKHFVPDRQACVEPVLRQLQILAGNQITFPGRLLRLDKVEFRVENNTKRPSSKHTRHVGRRGVRQVLHRQGKAATAHVDAEVLRVGHEPAGYDTAVEADGRWQQ